MKNVGNGMLPSGGGEGPEAVRMPAPLQFCYIFQLFKTIEHF
jgi:hypothetical protein